MVPKKLRSKAIPQDNMFWQVSILMDMGSKKDEKKAIEWYKKSAEQDFAAAQYDLWSLLPEWFGC